MTRAVLFLTGVSQSNTCADYSELHYVNSVSIWNEPDGWNGSIPILVNFWHHSQPRILIIIQDNFWNIIGDKICNFWLCVSLPNNAGLESLESWKNYINSFMPITIEITSVIICLFCLWLFKFQISILKYHHHPIYFICTLSAKSAQNVLLQRPTKQQQQ